MNDDDIKFDSDGNMLWNRVEPPYYWKAHDLHIVAERFDDWGMPEYIVYGDVENGTILGGAIVYSWDYKHSVAFSVNEEGWVHRWYRK